MGPLVVRRGDTLTAKTWANMGVTLSPAVMSQFSGWIAPLNAGGVATAGATKSPWVFRMRPLPAPGTTEYTIVIDGQTLNYRNTQTDWTNINWPNPQGGVTGARISATTFNGQTVEIANFPGEFGFERLKDMAAKKVKEEGTYEFTWTSGDISVAVDLQIISKPGALKDNTTTQGAGFKGMRLPDTVLNTSAPVAEPANASPPNNLLQPTRSLQN